MWKRTSLVMLPNYFVAELFCNSKVKKIVVDLRKMELNGLSMKYVCVDLKKTFLTRQASLRPPTCRPSPGLKTSFLRMEFHFCQSTSTTESQMTSPSWSSSTPSQGNAMSEKKTSTSASSTDTWGTNQQSTLLWPEDAPLTRTLMWVLEKDFGSFA